MVNKKPSGSKQGFPVLHEPSRLPETLITADGRDLRNIFVKPPKWYVGTTVPEDVYFRLLDYPGGTSAFYEYAIAQFDGSLEVLLDAAAAFSEERKRCRQTTGIRSANGRVTKDSYEKIVAIEVSLKGIRGMSKAKVLAGLIQLYLPLSSE